MESLLNRLEALREVIADDATARRISQAAAFRVIAEYKQRIFVEGQTTDGQQIGQYSVNPFYINPNNPNLSGVATSGIKPAGKYGQTIFKNGNPHKTKYLTNGYAELRQLTGRQNGTVDLNFSGSLFNSIKVQEVSGVSYVSYTVPELADRMRGQELYFVKDIATVSESEQQAGTEAAQLELLAILEDLDLA
jgi:hypothetical protein